MTTNINAALAEDLQDAVSKALNFADRALFPIW